MSDLPLDDDIDDDDDDGVPMAAQIAIVTCPHGNVYVTLLDAQGKPMAAIGLSADTAADVCDTMIEETEKAVAILQSTNGQVGHG